MRRMWWPAVLVVVSACGTGSQPATTVPAVSSTTIPSTTITTEIPVVSGEFSISNTTEGGGPVLVEAMAITVEYASDGTWVELPATCRTEPEAPVALEEELVVAYRCQPETAAPEGARLRGVVEATIFGSDEVFRMETEAG